MGETTGISWADSTFNPWMGCTKVGPACDHCYAEALMDHRWGKVAWGGPGKGVGGRIRTAPSNWSKPVTWNHKAAGAARPHFVFCASLADVFDNQVDPAWRADLFALIRRTPNLTWLLLTKRPQLIERLSLEAGGLPGNAALGATMVTPEEVKRDAPHLLAAKHNLRPAFAFVSAEPLLDDIAPALAGFVGYGAGVDWVITGGESGLGARPCHPAWVRNLRDLCVPAGVAFHHKQWGAWRPIGPEEGRDFQDHRMARADGVAFLRRSKEEAGRDLDGVTWAQRPTPRAVW